MNRVFRIALRVALALAAVLAVGVWVIESRARRTFDAPYPAIKATSEPAVVERGRYRVYGPAACAYCHVLREQWRELAAGSQLPLSGRPRVPLAVRRTVFLEPDVRRGNRVGAPDRRRAGAHSSLRRARRRPRRSSADGISESERSGFDGDHLLPSNAAAGAKRRPDPTDSLLGKADFCVCLYAARPERAALVDQPGGSRPNAERIWRTRSPSA